MNTPNKTEKLLTITQAAQFLNVSVNTLRRWDANGKLIAIRKERGTHRYYSKKDLEIFSSDLLKLANDWTVSGSQIEARFYCQNSSVFLARLSKLQDLLIKKSNKIFSLIVAISGEIGSNSYDHNLGNWPDVPGIFFGYDVDKSVVVLADRGLGILETLKRVRPNLNNHLEALHVAFTEMVSGRAPEKRGNGLKFVREVISQNPINLFFKSGDAELRMEGKNPSLNMTRSAVVIRGCLAFIKF